MTTNTNRRPGFNAVKGKKGFQEIEKSGSTLTLEGFRNDIGSSPAGVSTDLDASKAYELRLAARTALISAGHTPQASTSVPDYMRVVVAAQVFTLLNNHGTDVTESWDEGGINAAKASVHGGHISAPNDYYPITAERREAIAQEMLDVAMNQYDGANNSPVLYDGRDSNRDSYIDAACLALDDTGTRNEVANEIKAICDKEVKEGRDPRSLDRLDLYVQARTTVESMKDVGTCPRCGAPTVFNVDYGYAHCSADCS